MSYPSRPSHFANHYIRTVFRSCVAQEMGVDAVLLCVLVASTEDSARYTGPVSFWNNQLQEYLGFKKWERLNRARRAAITGGWLVYKAGGRNQPGLYHCAIPAQYKNLPSQLLGEAMPLAGVSSADSESRSPLEGGDQHSSYPSEGCREGDRLYPSEGEPSILPNPKEEKTETSQPGGGSEVELLFDAQPVSRSIERLEAGFKKFDSEGRDLLSESKLRLLGAKITNDDHVGLWTELQMIHGSDAVKRGLEMLGQHGDEGWLSECAPAATSARRMIDREAQVDKECQEAEDQYDEYLEEQERPF